MSLTDKAKSAVEDPSKVPPFLRRKTRQALGMPFATVQSRVNTRGLPRQIDRLDDLREEDSWLLIILDACRYDALAERFDDYFEGSIEPVRSEGHDTFEYIGACWPDQYPDTTYLSAAVPVNSKKKQFDSAHFNRLYGDYVPREHIGEIVDVWDEEWSPSLGICPPESVVDRVRNRGDEAQLVAHLFQPHAPYIGEEKLLGYTNNKHASPGEGNPVDAPIWEAVRAGAVSDEELRAAYDSNLERALNSVARLVAMSEHDRIAIMGDHGEALGEWGMYCHPRIEHPKIRTVPWCEVEGVRDDVSVDHTSTRDNEDRSEGTVEDRLEQLGYL